MIETFPPIRPFVSDFHAQLRRQLTSDEGRRASMYFDSLGFASIGIGKLIDARKGGRLTETEIDFIFDDSVESAERDLYAMGKWIAELDDVRLGALINMTFQMGPAGVMRFHKMIAALKAKDWQRAHDEALDSDWARQTPLRAQRMAKQLLIGEWQ